MLKGTGSATLGGQIFKHKAMLKTKFFLFPLICFFLAGNGCQKSRGTLFVSHFDTAADLALWSPSAEGQAEIESNYVKLKAVSGCFQYETANEISVEKDKTYILKFKGKAEPTLLGETGYCANDFMVYVEQGNNNPVGVSFGNFTSWTQKTFSFTATSASPVRIKFLIGTTKGVWLDELEFSEN